MPDREVPTAPGRVIRLEERGMIMIRADLEDERAVSAVAAAFGVDIPGLRRIVSAAGRELAWMSPDELLGFVSLDTVSETMRALEDAMAAIHHLTADVSAMRAEFEITGPVRDILAKGTPADVSPAAFNEGEIRRSRIGQLQAAFWLSGENAARILCRCSEAAYMQDWLNTASAPENAPGYYHR